MPDQEYWNEKVVATSFVSEGNGDDDDGDNVFLKNKEKCQRGGRRYYGSIEHEADHLQFYFSQVRKRQMCEMCQNYPYSKGHTIGAFSMQPCKNMSHLFRTAREI